MSLIFRSLALSPYTAGRKEFSNEHIKKYWCRTGWLSCLCDLDSSDDRSAGRAIPSFLSARKCRLGDLQRDVWLRVRSDRRICYGAPGTLPPNDPRLGPWHSHGLVCRIDWLHGFSISTLSGV